MCSCDKRFVTKDSIDFFPQGEHSILQVPLTSIGFILSGIDQYSLIYKDCQYELVDSSFFPFPLSFCILLLGTTMSFLHFQRLTSMILIVPAGFYIFSKLGLARLIFEPMLFSLSQSIS